MPAQLYDVIAINIRTRAERFMAQGKTLDNAEAIGAMAVIWRGLDGDSTRPCRRPIS
ncbi:MAG: hypothetical protein JO166_23780 [Deltaproteobacteria bacterium]|nr:hypothetical protein [Deltaproteobacteria bacterium]